MTRPKKIETPEVLWKLFEEYCEHERNSPMYKVEYVGKDGQKVLTPLQVPITFEGFECYLADKGIVQDLGDYSKNDNGRYTDYAPIITRIRKNCFTQNFKGASVGVFNSNLIAKKLGLTEKQEINTQQTITHIIPKDLRKNKD
jgi:hypothetical protein